MKVKIIIIASALALVFTMPVVAAPPGQPVQHHQTKKHRVEENDPLGRNHWTYGRRARMQKQIIQAKYHQREVDRAEQTQEKVARESRRKHIDPVHDGGL